jgi:hypothetical protein
MTDAHEAPTEIEYVVEYVDGPLAGESEKRVLVGGRYDERIGAVAAVDGLESLFWYTADGARDVAGEQHVDYYFDSSDSDPVESDQDDVRG